MKLKKFHSENVKTRWHITRKNVVIRETTPIDSYTCEEITPACEVIDEHHPKAYAVAQVDPIRMLFNQQRLDGLGATAAKAWIDSLSRMPNNALNELRKKCSDDDLISIVKSRHIQNPCELLAWSKYMDENMEQFNAELAKVVEEKQKQQSAVPPIDMTKE